MASLKDIIAQTRITKTPLFIGQQNPGIVGEYKPDADVMEQLKGLDSDMLNTLAQNWAGQRGIITIDPNANQNVIPHESAHVIYDQAGLKNQAMDLMSRVPDFLKNIILNSSLYGKMGSYSGSPEQITDESLGKSIGVPFQPETDYVNAVADKIKDNDLRTKLLRLHINAIKARSIEK